MVGKRHIGLTKNEKRQFQKKKFFDVLVDSGWDLGILAETLIKLKEKK